MKKISASEDCVSLAEVFEIMGNLMSIPYDFDRPINEDDVSKSMDKIKALPPVTPTFPSSEDCVSRQAVIDMTGLSNWFDSSDDYNSFVEDLCKLPPVTPAHCIAEVRFSKDDLREICNERIEIECTHGTCKDCENWDKEYHFCSMLDCDTGKDFYCKGFEKRGDLDGSN